MEFISILYQGCHWNGDYSELDSHLTNSQEHLGGDGASSKYPTSPSSNSTTSFNTASSSTASSSSSSSSSSSPSSSSTSSTTTGQGEGNSTDAIANAAALKKQGDAKYSFNQYATAIPLYTKSISVIEFHYDKVRKRKADQAAACEEEEVEEEEEEDTVEGNVANVGKAGIVNVSKVKRSQVKSQDETGEEEEEETELSKLHSACFLNRATSYFMLREYAKCASDCDQAIKISPRYKKAYIRKSASQVVLGHFKEAIFTMQQGVEKLPGDQEMIMELNKVMTLSDTYDAGVNMLMNEEWLKAKNLFADMLASKVISSSNAKILLGAAQAEIGIGMCDRAMKLTLQVCDKYICINMC
jgi:tetratricopeptide (TPR) repeat protein